MITGYFVGLAIFHLLFFFYMYEKNMDQTEKIEAIFFSIFIASVWPLSTFVILTLVLVEKVKK